MKYHSLLFKRSKDQDFKMISSNATDIITNSITKQVDLISIQLEDKNEQIVPLLEFQSYSFFYKIYFDKKNYLFCILAPSEHHNFFFNEIPFLKLKAQQFLHSISDLSFDEIRLSLENWFQPYEREKDLNLSDYKELLKNTKDFETLMYLLITSKKLHIITEDSTKFDSLFPLLNFLTPHLYINAQSITHKDDISKNLTIIASNKDVKLDEDFIEVNLEKKSIKFKGSSSGFIDNLYKKITETSNSDQITIKNELRPIITETIKLLELFQADTEDIFKTKTIESIKTELGTDSFHILLELAKSINNDIENQVSSYTKLEKKYSSFLSEF